MVVLVIVRVTGTTLLLFVQNEISITTKIIKANTERQALIPELDELVERCLRTVLTCLRTGAATPTPPPPIRPPLI